MQKSIFSVPNIHKGGIKSGHHFPYFSDKNIAYGKIVIRFLMLEFGKFTTFQ